jgi:hypothetical protein
LSLQHASRRQQQQMLLHPLSHPLVLQQHLQYLLALPQ